MVKLEATVEVALLRRQPHCSQERSAYKAAVVAQASKAVRRATYQVIGIVEHLLSVHIDARQQKTEVALLSFGRRVSRRQTRYFET
jgi:hypothetical protein